MSVRAVLKTTQIVVAIATAVAIGAGLVWPGMMVVFVVPVMLMYILWTIRAARDDQISIWLSFMATTFVAVFIGGLGVATILSIAGTRHAVLTDVPIPLADSSEGIAQIEPTAELLAHLAQTQMQVDQRALIEGSVLSFIGLGAWLVVGLYIVERKWAFGITSPK